MTVSAPPRVMTTSGVLPFTIGLGAVAIAGAVVNTVFGAMFPSNAPVEQVYYLGVTIDLVAIAVYCLVRTLIIVLARWQRVDSKRTLSVFGLIGAVLAATVFVVWALFGGIDYWSHGADRYMTAAAPVFFLGIPWVVSLVFADLAVRRNDTLVNSLLAVGTTVLSGIVGISTIVAAVIYGLGLSA